MATVTFQHSSFANGIVRVEFDVNDANWRVSRVRCINNSALPAAATILQSGTEVFTATAPANATTSWNTTGIQFGWNDSDLDGDGIVDGGLMMGDYVMSARWPAGA